MTTDSAYPPTIGVVLAGGAAKRMGGGDKPLRDIAGRSLLARTIERLQPQCQTLILNANGDAARFSAFDLKVIPDNIPGQLGPLSGILAGLDHIATSAESEWLLSAPADCPFLPRDLAKRLHAGRAQSNIVVARSAGQPHPVVALWHVSLRADLYHALAGEDVRKANAFVARHAHAIVDWPADPHDPFFNVNTPDDLAAAEAIAARSATD